MQLPHVLMLYRIDLQLICTDLGLRHPQFPIHPHQIRLVGMSFAFEHYILHLSAS